MPKNLYSRSKKLGYDYLKERDSFELAYTGIDITPTLFEIRNKEIFLEQAAKLFDEIQESIDDYIDSIHLDDFEEDSEEYKQMIYLLDNGYDRGHLGWDKYDGDYQAAIYLFKDETEDEFLLRKDEEIKKKEEAARKKEERKRKKELKPETEEEVIKRIVKELSEKDRSKILQDLNNGNY